MMKPLRKRNLFFSVLIVACVVLLYGILAAINTHTPMIVCKNGTGVLTGTESSMSLLAGEWLCYPDAPTMEELEHLNGHPIDVMHIGIMEGSTYRIQLRADQTDDLCFMLPRSRGSQVWIDGNAVAPQGESISSQDVFSLSDYANPKAQQIDFVLRIPVSGYFYSGYQGVVFGSRDSLESIDQIRYFIEVLCLGLYITLGLVCLVLFLQKTSERYILYLVFFTLLTAYRFMNFSEHFSSYPLFSMGSDFYRLFFFMRYTLCRAFVLPGHSGKKNSLDMLMIGMIVCEVAAYLFLPAHFAQLSTNINLIVLALEGILIVKGLLENRQGVRILLAGWSMYTGMEVFYRLLHIGIIPQGIVDVLIRPTQYAHVAYLIAFAAAVFGKFASKFSEAEEMAVSLEQKVLEQTQELREKNQRIIEEQNQRQQFMTDIVHNLRNPLFALGGYMELLESQMEQPTVEQKKYVDLIEDKLSYLNRMVDDMLLSNRLEHGKIRFHFIRLELSAFLRSVVMGNKRLEQCRQVLITCPELYLDADSFRLHQALDNLLDNAVIHGGCSSMEITAYQEESTIHLTIRDDGKGMTEEQVARAFDRYYTSGQKNSTGLGLAITAAIIREHGGQVALNSSPGEGVTLNIALPVERHETDEAFDEMKEA